MTDIPSTDALRDLEETWEQAQDMLEHAAALKTGALVTQDPKRQREILAEYAALHTAATERLARYWAARKAACA